MLGATSRQHSGVLLDTEGFRPVRKVTTMIDWHSDDWGNKVHYASNGSWVSDKQGDEPDGHDQ